jgi:nickel transport system ATP-binding protein
MISDSLLHIENLSIDSDKGPLVSDICLTARTGRVLGLVGESGSGKSLTCLAILNLLPIGLHRRGSIRLETEGETDKCRPGKTIAVILQNPMSCFNPIYTIRSHFRETLIAAGRSWNRESRKEVLAALSEVGFDYPRSILDLYPFQMSGGMLQRVMIGLALIQKVQFLIADEPTTDLDMIAQAKVLALLEKLKERIGLGILLVTHDLGVIAGIADEVAVMHQGKIIEQCSAEALFSTPKNNYTCDLLQAHRQLCCPKQTQKQFIGELI